MKKDQPTTEKSVFEGFEPANTTPVPDVLFDELLTVLSGPQLKVLLYIIRRTAGFKKSSDGISLSQFTDGIKTKDGKVLDKGCGIKKRSTVSKVLRELIAMGCVESAKAKTDMGDDAVTTYSVRFKGVVAKLALPSDEKSTTVVPKQPLPGSAQTATRGSANLATHKKQLTRNSNKQETERQEEGTLSRTDRTEASGFATASPAHTSESEEPYSPDLDYLQEIESTREAVNEALEAVEALSETSYSPEPPESTLLGEQVTEAASAGDYEKTEGEEDGTLAMGSNARTAPGRAGARTRANEDNSLTNQDQLHHAQGNRSTQDHASVPSVPGQRTGSQGGRTGKAAEQPALIVEKKPMSLDAQVDAALQVLDHVRKQASGKPFGYVHSGTAKDLLKDLIVSCKDTPNEINTANITLAWMAMWNAPRWSNGMSWQDPGKLTIKAFCNNYGEYLDIGRQAALKQSEPKRDPERGVSGLKRWVPPGMQAAITQ